MILQTAVRTDGLGIVATTAGADSYFRIGGHPRHDRDRGQPHLRSNSEQLTDLAIE